MMNQKIRLFACSAIASGCIFGAPQAIAQEQSGKASDEQAESHAAGMAEIIVTARRREESLLDVPVSVTAISGEKLAGQQIHDLADLNNIAPNFQIRPAAALFRNAALVFARGVGYSNIDATLDPRVGVSVDGIFYDRNVGVLQNMFDLEGVELLLGPQGTLYGKNTVGGVINIKTAKPKDHFEIEGMYRYGNFGRSDAQIVVNIPLSSTLAFRAAFQSQHSDGYYKNTYVSPQGVPAPEPTIGGDDTRTFRGTLAWKPNETFDATLTGTHLRNRSQSVGATNVSSPTELASVILGAPGYGYPGGPTDPFKVPRSFPSGDYFDLDGVTLNMAYHGNGFDVISLTGYIDDGNPVNFNDFSAIGISFFQQSTKTKHHQFSQEVRLQSTGSGPFQWQGGVFYDNTFYTSRSVVFQDIGIVPFNVQTHDTTQWKHSISGFGEINYAITDKLNITLGGRLLNETKRFQQYPDVISTVPVDTFPASSVLRAKKSWSAFTYHAGADYHFTPDVMGYVSYSTGWVSGGFNSSGVSLANLGPFNPQKAKSFEASLKASLFDRRLNASLTGFWAKYEDIQVFSFVPGPPPANVLVVVSNDPNQVAKGIEFQATAVPVDPLRLDLSVGYLDTYYSSFQSNLFGTGTADFSYLKPERSPKWTLRAGAAYEIRLGTMGTLTPSVNYSYQSVQQLTLANAPQGKVGGYGLLDANLTYQSADEKWSVAVFGRNLTDKLYPLGVNPVAGLFTNANYASPRTYGIELRVKLGE